MTRDDDTSDEEDEEEAPVELAAGGKTEDKGR